MTLADVVLSKKWELDALRHALRPDALDSLEHSQRIDITFTSNAIEGNSLTAAETALIIEKGITVAGKPLKDHLEAVEHAKALAWVLDLAKQNETPIREADLRTLHRLATEQSAPGIAGRYADRPRVVNADAGIFNFPEPAEVRALMADFAGWLAAAPDEPSTAFQAHLGLVSVHPFNDGNSRAARLLMNLILARAGYPPIAVRPEDRPAYLRALETAQGGSGGGDFNDLLYRRLDQTLDIYLAAARQAQDASAIQKRT
jgi:Fic family protein